MNPSRITRRAVVLSLRAVVSTILLAILIYSLDWGELWRRYSDIVWPWVGVALVVQLAVRISGAVRWWTLLRNDAPQLRIKQLIKPVFIGGTISHALPTSFGGDLYRIYFINKELRLPVVAFASVTADRLFGLTLLVVVAAVSAPWSPILAERDTMRTLFFAGILVMVVLATLWSVPTYFSARADRLRLRFDDGHILHKFMEVLDALAKYLKRPGIIAAFSVVGLGMLVMQIFVFVFLAKAVSSTLGISPLLFAVPALLVASSLPISIGGLGIREGAGTILLELSGMEYQEAALIALLFGCIWILSSIPGIAYLAIDRGYTERAQESSGSDCVDDRKL